MDNRTNLAGQNFGSITLASPVPGRPGYWNGTCYCGNTVVKRIDNLKRPGDHSCGRCRQPSAITPAEVLAQLKKVERELNGIQRALLSGSWIHEQRPQREAPDFNSASWDWLNLTPKTQHRPLKRLPETLLARFSSALKPYWQ